MFSCLHLTSACIQVVRSSTSENGNSRLLCFDWLFQTFWHWRVLLSRWTEPENAILIIFFDEVGRRPGPFVWANGRIYVHLLQSIFCIYYAKGRPTLYSGPLEKLPVLQMAVRHCLDVTLTYYLATTSSCSSLHVSLSSVEPKIRYFKDCC